MTTLDLLAVPGAEPEADQDEQHWLEVARSVAKQLGEDAIERDRGNKAPVAEVELLRDAGLLTLTIPREFGGQGQSFRTAFNVVREIARADGSIAQLLGYHLDLSSRFIRAIGTPVAERLMRETAEHRWLWATNGISPDRSRLILRPDGEGYRMSGHRTFATGSSVADRILAYVVLEDTNACVAVSIDPSAAGATRLDDWDVLGQRLSASNGVKYEDYFVDRNDIVGTITDPDSPFRLGLTSQNLVFIYLYLGIAEGAILAAREYTRTRSRPWTTSNVKSATEDPFVLNRYGELLSRLQGLAALAAQAEQSVEWAYSVAFANERVLTPRERGEVATLVASAKVISTQVSLDVTSQIYELMGARATQSGYGFDLYWRNVRTHTLHDPVSYKINEVGRFFLNDTFPRASSSLACVGLSENVKGPVYVEGREAEVVDPIVALDRVARGALLVDVRSEKGRAAEGSIPGAVVVAKSDVDSQFDLRSSTRLSELSGLDQAIVVLCSSEAGSGPVTQELLAWGYKDVAHVKGGFSAWKNSGLPVGAPE